MGGMSVDRPAPPWGQKGTRTVILDKVVRVLGPERLSGWPEVHTGLHEFCDVGSWWGLISHTGSVCLRNWDYSFVCLLRDQVSLYSQGWPETGDSVPASQLLGSQALYGHTQFGVAP